MSARDARVSLVAAALGIGVGVGAFLVGLRASGALEWSELRAYDLMASLRADRSGLPAPDVVLVRIREQEIARYGHPLPDTVLAEAIGRLREAEATAIGIDLYRVAPAEGLPREGWERLAEVSRAAPVVFIEKLPEGREPGVPPPAFARPERGQVGFSDLLLDRDGAVRRGLLMMWDERGRASLAFSLQLALWDLRREGLSLTADPDEPEFVRLGGTTIPPLEPDDGAYVDVDAGGYQYLLDFQRAEGFPSHTLEALLSGEVEPEALADHVVILGTTSPSVKDDFRTPLGDARMSYGIEVHAHAVDHLLRAAHGEAEVMGFWRDRTELLWILAWSLFGALLATRVRSPLTLTAASLLGLLALVGITLWLFVEHVWIPVVTPALASVGSAALMLAEVTRRERSERAVVMDLFGRYVSHDVAEQLWNVRDAFMDGGRPCSQRLVLTAMLTDLKGYTSAAEKMDPVELMAWVNEYMDLMTRVIEQYGGFVDDYTGDGIKANFGVPVARATPSQVGDDARTAVRCALAMGRALEDLDRSWRARGLPEARMRIGIHTGEAVVGSIGSERRMKYTTVGDTVNTAARLETFRKEEFEAEAAREGGAKFRVLVGAPTREHLGDDFRTEFLGEHALRGRGEPVGIHRVLGLREEASCDGSWRDGS